jgi:hypothetical protein
VPTVALLYLFCFIDRANIGNARLAGLEEGMENPAAPRVFYPTNTFSDLGMDPESYDYNTVLSCFFISYIIFEIPCSLLNKWIGPGWFIPAISLGFGVASLAMGFVRNMASACGVRLCVAFANSRLIRIADEMA